MGKHTRQVLLKDVDRNPLSYRESSSFGADEVSFISSGLFWGAGKRTLVYYEDTISVNDLLLLIIEDHSIEADIYIICNKIEKNRKIYLRLNKDKAVDFYEVDSKSFSMLAMSTAKECDAIISTSAINLMKSRAGLGRKDVVIPALNICDWIRAMAALTKNIDVEVVKKVVSENRESSVWKLKTALIQGESDLVMEIADTILSSKGVSHIAVLSAMINDFRYAYKLSLFSDRKSEAIAAIGKHNAYNYNDCKRYAPAQLMQVLNSLTIGIEHLKTGYKPDIQIKVTLSECLIALDAHVKGGC